MSKKPTKIFIQEKNDPRESSRKNTQARLLKKLEDKKSAKNSIEPSLINLGEGEERREENISAQQNNVTSHSLSTQSAKAMSLINNLLKNANTAKEFEEASNLVKIALQKMIELNPIMEPDHKNSLSLALDEYSRHIYIKFFQTEIKINPIDALKILFKWIDFYREFYAEIKISDASTLDNIFKFSVSLIKSYVEISEVSDAFTSDQYGKIENFLELHKKISALLPIWQKHMQLLKQTQGTNSSITVDIKDYEKTLIKLDDKGLNNFYYYVYTCNLTSAILNYVSNAMHQPNIFSENSYDLEKINAMEVNLITALNFIKSISFDKLVEFQKDLNVFLIYTKYGNSAKIFGRLIIINIIQIDYYSNILKEAKNKIHEEFYGDDYASNNIFFAKDNKNTMEKFLPIFSGMIKNYKLFIEFSKQYIKSATESISATAGINAYQEINELVNTINHNFSLCSESVFNQLPFEKELTLFNVLKAFIPILISDPDYGSSKFVNNIIDINFQLIIFYIRIDEIEEAKTLYNQSVILLKKYSEKYPEYFQELKNELAQKINFYLFILYNEIITPVAIAQELTSELDKENALKEYQKILDLIVSQGHLKWIKLETLSGTVFHLEVFKNVNYLSAAEFITELATYLKRYLRADTIAYSATHIAILGYELVPVIKAIKNIEQLKVKIYPPEKTAANSKYSAHFSSIFLETRSEEENSNSTLSILKPVAHIRKQKRLEQTIDAFLQYQQRQQEIAKVKAELRRQQKLNTLSASAANSKPHLSSEQESNNAATLSGNLSVQKKSSEQLSSNSNLKKGFFKSVTHPAAKSVELHDTLKNKKLAYKKNGIESFKINNSLAVIPSQLLANIHLNMGQIKFLLTSEFLCDEYTKYTNLRAYTRQVFLSLMLWENYYFKVDISYSMSLGWMNYRHAIVHNQWNITLLEKAANELNKYLTSDMSRDEFESQLVPLNKGLKECISDNDLNFILCSEAVYKENIKQELICLTSKLDDFSLEENSGIEQLQTAYRLWNEQLLTGARLNNNQQFIIQKIVTILEIFVSIGENYAQLKKLTSEKMRKQLFPEEDLLYFLNECKNIYRNELCHYILFNSYDVSTKHTLNPCQIFESEFIESCKDGMKAAYLLNNKSYVSLSIFSEDKTQSELTSLKNAEESLSELVLN